MDRSSDPESLPADQATDIQEQQLSDINLENVELVEEIDYQDREISTLRDFNVQQGLLLNAAARFSAYCHSRIIRHRKKLNKFGGHDSQKEVVRLVAELEVHDIRKNIVRLVKELEPLLTDRDAVGEGLRATTKYIASVIEQIQQIENEPPDLPQAEDIGSDSGENTVEHGEGDRMSNGIEEPRQQLGDIQAVNRRFQNPGVAELSHVREKAIGVRSIEGGKKMPELVQQNYDLERGLDLSRRRIETCLRQAEDLKWQLEKRESECQAELGRLRSENDKLGGRNDDLIAWNGRLEDAGTRQDAQLTILRRDNKELQNANDLLRWEIQQLENRITSPESRNWDDGLSVGQGSGKASQSSRRTGQGSRRIQQGSKMLQHENEDLQAESPNQLEVVVEPKLEVIIEPRKQAKGRAPPRQQKQLDKPNLPRRSKRLKGMSDFDG